MWLGCVLVVVLLGLPVALVALVANRAQRRSLEALEALEASAPQPAPVSPSTLAELTSQLRRRPPMLRTSSALRLAAARAVLTAGFLALPAAFLATGSSGLQPGHLGWFVLAAHGGVGVALASWLEHRAALRRLSPGRATLLAIAAAAASWVVGTLQAVYASHALPSGAGLEALQQRVEEAARDPAGLAMGLAVGALLATVAWGVPIGVLTRERMRDQVPPPTLIVAVVVTAGAAIPAYLLMSMVYESAEALDGWVGGRADVPPQ